MALVPKHIKQLAPYVAGKPIDEIKRHLGLKTVIKLASNENPSGPSIKAMNAAKEALSSIHRYPDSSGYKLRSKLSQQFNLSLKNVIIGAGSEGIMSNIMRTFLKSEDEIIASLNSFIGFRVLADASGIHTNWVPMKNYHYDLPQIVNNINEYTKIIYLANADNPTGTYFNISEFEEFIKQVPERVLVILDEAYFEYSEDISDYPNSMLYRYDNIITLRTFSKIYGLAGLRVGYGFAHENLINNLMKVKLPFEPSIPAQEAAYAALDDKDHITKTLEINLAGKEVMQKAFQEYKIQFIDSITNFIMLKFDSEEEANIFTLNLLEEGIIIRNLKSFGLPRCVRVSIGTDKENKYFLDKLNTVMNKV